MRSRLKTMKRCCHGTAHQKCHGKHEALLAVGVVYGSDTTLLSAPAGKPLGALSMEGNMSFLKTTVLKTSRIG
jgi:hypothetical protein